MRPQLHIATALIGCGFAGLAWPETLAVVDTPVTGGARDSTGQFSELRSELPIADEVVVYKSTRRMQLLRRGQVLRTYRVSLGLQPAGPKERSGDFRTPEGSYRLTRRNARSEFFLSIQVSYPNANDERRARRNGHEPGGSIMIHGLPNTLRRTTDYYSQQDWTDGCIALSNSDMVEFWLLTQDNLPIEIRP